MDKKRTFEVKNIILLFARTFSEVVSRSLIVGCFIYIRNGGNFGPHDAVGIYYVTFAFMCIINFFFNQVCKWIKLFPFPSFFTIGENDDGWIVCLRSWHPPQLPWKCFLLQLLQFEQSFWKRKSKETSTCFSIHQAGFLHHFFNLSSNCVSN